MDRHMSSKVATMQDAVRELVRDGDTVAIEGFTHLICFAAGHEIIRQGRRDLTLARMTPDVIYDQMIAGGVASKLIFSWLGNPGVGSLHAIRRRIERADPAPLEIEEYSHFGMVSRYVGGASYAQGYYDRDNRFYLDWDAIARDAESLDGWLREWVLGLESHAEYVKKLGAERWASLEPGIALSGEVNYGRYA